MNQQIYLVATVFLSVAVVFLFYQNVKLERRFNREVQSLTNNMKDMGKMIALNNDISTDKNYQEDINSPIVSNPISHTLDNTEILGEPEVSTGLVNEMSSLMRDYSEFNEPAGLEDEPTTPDFTNEALNTEEEALATGALGEVELEKYDSISEELKREIEELEKRDSSNEGVDEPTKKFEGEEELEEDIEEIDLSQSTEIEGTVGTEGLEELSMEPEELEGNIQTFDENALEELNPSGDYKNMVDDIIATASEAENNNEIEETKASWDGSVDITDEGVFVELDNQRKEVSTLSVKELTYLCKMSGIKSKGKKAELISRFTDYSTQKKNTFFLESQ
jgi:hypothetical protein